MIALAGSYLSLQGRFLRPLWPLVLLLGVLLLAGTALRLIAPQMVRQFIDLATEQGSLNLLYTAAIIFIATGVGGHLVIGVTRYLGSDVAWRATNRLRSDITSHVLQLDMGFHSTHQPGDLLERIDGDVLRLSNYLSLFLVQIVGSLLLLAGLVVVAWLEDWRFGLVVAGFATLYILATARANRIITPLWGAEGEARSDIYGFLGEWLSGVKDVQKSGANSFAMFRFYQALRARVYSWLRVGIIARVVWGVVEEINGMRIPVALAAGAILYQRGDITIGTVYLMYHYLMMSWIPITAIGWQMEDLQRAGASIRRLRDVLDTKSKVEDGRGLRIPAHKVSLQFRIVSFGYHPGVEVIHDISFRLEAGRSLGLLGRTGAGKSTISKLLFRLYDPDRGSVHLGDIDIKDVRLEDLRNRIGMVSQSVQILRAAVRDNLTLFDQNIPDERIIATLDDLGLGSWLNSLPQGLDEDLSAGREQLSAGEAQLLAFARVFLRDPAVVVLDEATSRLDPATERLVQRATTGLLKDRTAVVIAHRLATVQTLDEIMVIEDGRVMEHGERAQLARNPDSRFSGLLRTGLEVGTE